MSCVEESSVRRHHANTRHNSNLDEVSCHLFGTCLSLTLRSGHAPRAIEGIEELKSLISKAKALPRNLVITLASGINASAAAELLEKIPHIEELHLTGSGSVIAEQTAVAEKGRQMGFGLEEWRLDSGKIDAFWDVLQKRAS